MVPTRRLAVAVVVCVLACAALYFYRTYGQVWGLQRVDLDADPTLLRTGDLILFRTASPDSVDRWFTAFSHVGVVVEDGGPRYVLETHERGDGSSMGVEAGGVHLYPLTHRVRTYAGSTYALRLRPDIDVQARNLWTQWSALLAIPYDSNYKRHFGTQCLPRRVCPACVPSREQRQSMFCSEFVGLVYKLTGVLPPDFAVDCLTPESFVHLKVGSAPLFLPLLEIRR